MLSKDYRRAYLRLGNPHLKLFSTRATEVEKVKTVGCVQKFVGHTLFCGYV